MGGEYCCGDYLSYLWWQVSNSVVHNSERSYLRHMITTPSWCSQIRQIRQTRQSQLYTA